MTPRIVPRPDDEHARKLIRESLGESLIVEASAGTGKTHELVQRIVAVLAAGAKIDGVVAVTFTNKAAGELQLRLRQELDRARAGTQNASEQRNLEDALERLEEAAIGTIHSFCARILRERPVESGVDPAFQEIAEPEARRIHAAAFRAWLEQRMTTSNPVLERAFARLATESASRFGPPLQQLENASWSLAEWRDHPSPWRREPFDRAAEIDALLPLVCELRELAELAPGDDLAWSLHSVTDFADWVERRRKSSPRNDDETEARLLDLDYYLARPWLKKGRKKMFAEGLPREIVLDKLERLKLALARFLDLAAADLAPALRDELWQAVEEYEKRKLAAGKLDFLDLLLRAGALVRENEAVRSELQRRFTHIFVDEFQDTDPLQAEILLLLAAQEPKASSWLDAVPAPGKLFLVGDPKQSIYKFRRADVCLYERIRARLEEHGVRRLVLTKSYRAVRPIQEFVNAAFEPEMQAAAGQPAYAPLEEHRSARRSQPSVVALPVPEPRDSRGEITIKQINSSLPGAVVAYIDWLLNESDWHVCEGEDRWTPIKPGHIAVLFRRQINWGDDLSREYARGLQARSIPHILAGSKSFHGRDEIITLRAALTAIEWPNDELSVWATLRGALFAIEDAVLLRYKKEHGRLNPIHLPETAAEEFAPVVEALECLRTLHRARNRRPIAGTINELLEINRAHAVFALRPGGDQVLANVYRLCDLARDFELSEGLSFRAFVEELLSSAERVETAEALASDTSTGGVRLMTVHSAKGLEFPVVILADITAKLHSRSPDRHVDSIRGVCAGRLVGCLPAELRDHEEDELARERAEGVRVAYVAATRARDLLVAPFVPDEERPDWWIGPLEKALRDPDRAVCCDLSILKLEHDEDFGVKREQLIKDGPSSGLGREAWHAWQAAHNAAVESGIRPSIDILTPSSSAAAPDFDCEVRLEHVERKLARPAGPRFGALVHAILRDIDFAATRDQIEATARLQGRIFGATDEERAAAAGAVEAALGHELLARARKAARVHREYPIALKLAGNQLLEGVVDLAFLEDDTWHIVDFKTDESLEASVVKKYEGQLRWYALALARINNMTVCCWLLAV